MKLNYTTGCICNNLSVDNDNFNDLTLAKRKDVLHKIINESTSMDIDADYFLQQLLICVLENIGTYKGSDEPCECCGDNIETFDLEIED